jgi:hypothetical protein
MIQYLMRVRLINGSFTEVPIHAKSPEMAIAILESQFGPGTYMGTIDTTYLKDDD